MARSLCWLALLVLALALGVTHAEEEAPEDASKLLALRDAVENWEEFAEANDVVGWEAAVPVCEWTGVVCGNGTASVVELDLACTGNRTEGLCAVQAVGTLAAELSTLETLEVLNVAGQALAGTLPEAWGTKGAYKQLLALSLADNNLSGGIPASWGGRAAFPALEALELSGNPLLCGDVPEALQLRLLCGEAAEECTDGQLPACTSEGKEERQDSPECGQGQLLEPPSWAEYNVEIRRDDKAQAAEEQLAKNRRIVRRANEDSVRYDFVLMGDSITQRADVYPGPWRDHFGGLAGPSAPLGVIFSKVNDLGWRISSGDELFTLPPKALALLIGVNNIERGPQPAEQLEELIRWLQAAYPSTRIILLNLLPADVGVYLDIEGTNRKYKRVAEETGVQYSTCGSDIDASDRSQLSDGIHPAPGGLDTLFACLAPQVEAAVAASPC